MTRFLRVCLEPGCPELVRKGRCVRHGREFSELQEWRIGEASWVYRDPRWRRLRERVRREQPTCARVGCTLPWTDLDHRERLRDVIARGGDPFDRDNAHGLCAPHHSAKTLEETIGRRVR